MSGFHNPLNGSSEILPHSILEALDTSSMYSRSAPSSSSADREVRALRSQVKGLTSALEGLLTLVKTQAEETVYFLSKSMASKGPPTQETIHLLSSNYNMKQRAAFLLEKLVSDINDTTADDTQLETLTTTKTVPASTASSFIKAASTSERLDLDQNTSTDIPSAAKVQSQSTPKARTTTTVAMPSRSSQTIPTPVQPTKPVQTRSQAAAATAAANASPDQSMPPPSVSGAVNTESLVTEALSASEKTRAPKTKTSRLPQTAVVVRKSGSFASVNQPAPAHQSPPRPSQAPANDKDAPVAPTESYSSDLPSPVSQPKLMKSTISFNPANAMRRPIQQNDTIRTQMMRREASLFGDVLSGAATQKSRPLTISLRTSKSSDKSPSTSSQSSQRAGYRVSTREEDGASGEGYSDGHRDDDLTARSEEYESGDDQTGDATRAGDESGYADEEHSKSHNEDGPSQNGYNVHRRSITQLEDEDIIETSTGSIVHQQRPKRRRTSSRAQMPRPSVIDAATDSALAPPPPDPYTESEPIEVLEPDCRYYVIPTTEYIDYHQRGSRYHRKGYKRHAHGNIVLFQQLGTVALKKKVLIGVGNQKLSPYEGDVNNIKLTKFLYDLALLRTYLQERIEKEAQEALVQIEEIDREHEGSTKEEMVVTRSKNMPILEFLECDPAEIGIDGDLITQGLLRIIHTRAQNIDYCICNRVLGYCTSLCPCYKSGSGCRSPQCEEIEGGNDYCPNSRRPI